MTEQDGSTNGAPDGREPNDAEMGEPIAELAQLGWSAGPDFDRKVTRGIERRLLTGRLLDVAWAAPLTVLLELLRAPLESFSRSVNRRERP